MGGAYDLIAKRCDRAMAVILTVKEKECDQFLDEEAKYQLRKVVLDQINELKEFIKDLMDTVNESTVIANQLYLERIETLVSEMGRNRDGD